MGDVFGRRGKGWCPGYKSTRSAKGKARYKIEKAQRPNVRIHVSSLVKMDLNYFSVYIESCD